MPIANHAAVQRLDVPECADRRHAGLPQRQRCQSWLLLMCLLAGCGEDEGRSYSEDNMCFQSLDCEFEDCSSYAPKPERCIPNMYGSGIDGEGVCGEYRFRWSGGSLSSETRYWDRATGKLVTIVQNTDYGAHCGSSQTLVQGDREPHDACEQEVDAAREAICNEGPDSGVFDEDGGV
jgi:hypothetical protein